MSVVASSILRLSCGRRLFPPGLGAVGIVTQRTTRTRVEAHFVCGSAGVLTSQGARFERRGPSGWTLRLAFGNTVDGLRSRLSCFRPSRDADVPKLSAETSTRPSPSAESAAPLDSGCPTPLACQEVLQVVRADSRSYAVDAGPVSMRASVFGAGEPLYLLAGFVGDHELHVLTSWLLREECCCVMLDPPRAETVSRETLGQFAKALTAMADEIGHPQFRLHATSFGSLIALRTMLDQPGRVTAASLHCGFAVWRLSLAERLMAAMGRRSGRSLGDFSTAVRLQSVNHRQWFPPFDGARWNFYLQNVTQTPVAEIAFRAAIANAVDLRSELGRIQTPVLLIDSEGDGRISSAAQAELASHLAHSRTDSLDNCGRLPHVTHPHRLVKSLRAFWEETTWEETT